MDRSNHKDDCCGHDHAPKTEAPAPQRLNSDPNTLISSFLVAGMDCGDEIKAIEQALAIPGVGQIQANLMASTVKVQHSKDISSDEIRKKIESTGVKVANPDKDVQTTDKRRVALVLLSGIFAGFAFGAESMGSSLGVTAALSGASVLLGGSLVFPKAWRSLLQRSLDMNVLMSVAVLGAVGIRQWTEAATVVFLFSLSELLEALSVARARKAIGEVLTITPETATLIDSTGKHSDVATESIVIGSLILVKSGERIPMDGEVKNGTSFVNQAALTGESVPVEKKAGDSVFAGTINESSVLEILVSSSSENSKVAQIIRMVEEAQGQKAPSERFVDSFAKIYTPVVFVLAILTLVVPPLAFHQDWGVWFYKALVLLVVACPCALVISTPVSIVSALTALARKGVLVKGGAFLEILGKVRAIAVDKTGTITEGTPTVHQVILIGTATEENVVQVAASVEKLSSHPLAVAVVRYAEGLSIPLKPATDFKNILGKGAEAKIEGHEYFLGNHRFAHELGVCTPELEKQLAALEEKSLSVIVVGHRPHSGCEGEVLGILAVGDVIRKDAKQAVQELKDAGIESMIMLSGDNQRTATTIARSAGISEAIGDLLPEGKVSEMKRLVQKYGVVAMIGDGINDAPALAEASVGIAMGGIGTDTAIETADVALMRDDLKQVVVAIRQGRRALSVIRFNIGFALLLKAAFLVLTFIGFANLWLAVGADTGASLLVIFNSLRLLRIKA